jgi:hypothetical protein
MATKGEQYETLRDFLLQSFSPREFATFLKLKGYAEIAEAVTSHVEGGQFFFDVIEAMDRRGEIDRRFFDCLTRERPRKKAEIAELAADWLGEDPQGSQPQPSPGGLAAQVKSAATLVELVCGIGKAVQPAGYPAEEAAHACSQYRQRYEQKYGHVKIIGMSEPVPLASIYTEACVVPPTFLRGYRSQEELQELFLRQGRSLAGTDSHRDPPRPALEVANEEKHRFLNLLGPPGAGKSTFLRYIGWMALQAGRPGTTPPRERPLAASRYRFNLLPVLLELRSVRHARDFVVLLDEELRLNGFPAGFGRAALQAGGLLVLLDGLDEVPADTLNDTIHSIRDLVDQHPGCRYLTSCRTAFYKDYFPQFTDALLTDFTDDQIQNLIHNWFRSERDRQLGTAAALWDLLQDPNHRATRELARTPLLATFLCLIYDDRQKLPANRAELYGDALRILLERWGASKRVHGEPVFLGLSTKRELSMLEAIAGPAYERAQYFFTAGELATAIEKFLGSAADRPDQVDGRQVVEEIERRQGLLVQRAHDKYSFSHLTLQEYLAACHYSKSGRAQEVARTTLTQPHWREVHLLLAGLQEPDADAFLLALAIGTAEEVTSKPLQGLLSWAGWIVSVGSSPRQTAARRALVLGFALALARALAVACADESVRVYELSHVLDVAGTLAVDLARALTLAGTWALAGTPVLARTYEISLVSALDRARTYARAVDRARNLGSVLIDQGMIAAERSAGLAEACGILDRHFSNWGTLSDDAAGELENALDLPQHASRFARSDAQECVDFLTRTRRILECREAAERVTQAGWDQVCERLIALPRSS